MEPVSEALQLLRREAELREAMRAPGGVRITEEREWLTIAARLQRIPEATRAVMGTVTATRRPLQQLSVEDVERWAHGP
jgi:hypothetical protein